MSKKITEQNHATMLQGESKEKEAMTVRTPDTTAYKEHIDALPAEDKAFLDGFLYAKVTEAAQRGA